MNVTKRDGRIVPFSSQRIAEAIKKAMKQTINGVDENLSMKIAESIENRLLKQEENISVEAIQDMVEKSLMTSNRKDVAKEYIIYRHNRMRARSINKQEERLLSDEFISNYKHRENSMTPLGEFVYYRTYSRYLPEENRREFWWETVRRAVEYNCGLANIKEDEAQQLFDNVYNLKQFLSGRTLWVGGTDVAYEYSMSNFNCAYETIEEIDSFVDLLYLLMLGSGVGVRILKEDVEKIPTMRTNYEMIHKEYAPVKKYQREEFTSLEFKYNEMIIVIGDSKKGWVSALRYYFEFLTNQRFKDIGKIIFNYDNVRPSGEKLKTFGGTASGHEALKNIFIKIDDVLKENREYNYLKLRPIHCLDIVNIIGEGVVVGGVRRTSEIVLIDSDDEECINAKTNLYTKVNDEWILNNKLAHRFMSNNSIFYRSKPTREQLHWQINKMRYSGEPAFVNEKAASKRRENFKGLNPCGEILLDSQGMCNLTTINVMAFVKDGKLDYEDLYNAQKLSARAGYRMTCVDLDLPEWDKVQKRDRLTGCSLTGWQDMVNATNISKEKQIELLRNLKKIAKNTVEEYAKELNQNNSLLVTSVKPEGSLSLLPTVSSGIHYSHAPYYIRRIRINANDPLAKVCQELGYPMMPDVGQTLNNCKTMVIEFPVKSPNGKCKYDVSAIEQLENYKMFMENYVDHNVSITVHVREGEWDDVEQWMWENWDDVVAVTFLSLDNSFYELMPYEAIAEEEYFKRASNMKKFIPRLIEKYETSETEFEIDDSACESGVCPLR